MDLSYSSLSVMKNCPRCFWYDRKMKQSQPEGIKSSVPQLVDKILKESFDAYRGTLPPSLKMYPQLEGFQLLADTVLLKKIRHYKSNPYCMTDEFGNKIHGAFDDLLHNPATGQYAFLDYKTTGKEPGNDFGERYYQSQCDIYTNFLVRGKIKVPDFGVLLFFWPMPGKDGQVEFKSKAIILKPNPLAADLLFQKAIEILDADEPPAAPGTCEFCAFVETRKI